MEVRRRQDWRDNKEQVKLPELLLAIMRISKMIHCLCSRARSAELVCMAAGKSAGKIRKRKELSA